MKTSLKRRGAIAGLFWHAAFVAGGCSSLFGDDFKGRVLSECGTERSACSAAGDSGPPDQSGGNRGSLGASGSAGASGGDNGASGSAGASGGDNGASGSAGASGGNNGASGSAGASGGASDANDAASDGGGSDASGGGNVDGSDGSTLTVPPRGTLWNDGRIKPYVPVIVSFTTTPHREWNGTLRCTRQTLGSACSGDLFAGTDEASLRDSLRVLLENTWMRVTNLEFQLFSSRGATTPHDYLDTKAFAAQIVVTFVTKGSDPEPSTQSVTGIGKHADFATDIHVDWQGLRDRNPDAIRTILREFGRALGFPYEWLRGPESKAPMPCPADFQPDPDLRWIPRPYLDDYQSVMDRCTPASDSLDLSAGDVVGAQQEYGLKHPGALVGYRGKCVTVENDSSAAGSPLIALPCMDMPNDFWNQPPSSPSSRFQDKPGNRCLSVSGGAVSAAASTPVVSMPCSTELPQRFAHTNLEWRAVGNMCLEAVNGYVESSFCNGSPAQRWNFWNVDPATPLRWDQIQSVGTGLCAASATLDRNYNEQIILKPCSPTDETQRFLYFAYGFVYIGNDQKCLNVLGGQPVPGQRLGIWNGCGNPVVHNGQFHVSGSWKALGQCLSMQGAGDPFDLITVEPCSRDSETQTWDFHF